MSEMVLVRRARVIQQASAPRGRPGLCVQIADYWVGNITKAVSPCADLQANDNGSNTMFYSSVVNKQATDPSWVNVGNTSFGSISTPPNGSNFALQGASAAIGYGSHAAPFDFPPAIAVDAGACNKSVSVCP